MGRPQGGGRQVGGETWWGGRVWVDLAATATATAAATHLDVNPAEVGAAGPLPDPHVHDYVLAVPACLGATC